MDNKKNKIMTMVFIVSILILVVSTTYAFFAPQNGGTTSTNAIVTSNTTDLLTFSINRDISFTVTQALFAQNGENQSGDATATATLTPNNKTGAATMNYYLYLNLQSNPTVYSEANTNNDPELMLQVFDGNNQLVTLTGLGTQKTIKGVTGYDITGVRGLKTLLDNHAISATNNTAAIENWRVVITLINLDVNQNDNTGKTISAEIIIQQNELDLRLNGIIYRNNSNVTFDGYSYVTNATTAWCDASSGELECDSGGYYPSQEICQVTYNHCQNYLGATGVGSYELSMNSIINKEYDATWLLEQGEELVENFYYFDTYDECSAYTYGNANDYLVCTQGKIKHPFYLKQTIVNDIIEKTETCLSDGENEFCFNTDYWVDEDYDGSQTLTKFNTDFRNTFSNSTIDYCYNSRGYLECAIEFERGSVMDTYRVIINYGESTFVGQEKAAFIDNGKTSEFFMCQYYKNGVSYCK